MSSSNTSSEPSNSPRHFLFTEEHEQLRESIRSFVERELQPHADAWEQEGFPDSVFKRMGELGLLGLSYPEEYGGQGGDYICNIVLAEEMARCNSGGVAGGVAVHTDMATPPILQFGTEEQKQRYLKPAVAGDLIAALAITEPDTGSDVAAIKTRAVRDGDDWVINGSKIYITNGARANFTVVVAKTDPDKGYDGISLFIVDTDLPGYTVQGTLKKLGLHASDTAVIGLDSVRVPASALLGELNRGFYQIMWELQGERLASAAGSVAGAQHVFEKTLAYSLERQAFGRKIGNFQVTRHKFAQMATALESARQMVYSSAWSFANGGYPVREISMAKLHAARVAVEVADECIQIHGGAGYMTEYGIERAWRDLRLNRIAAGSDEIMLEIIGRSYGL